MLLAIHRAAITTREDNRCISAVRSILRSAALARRQSRFNTRERGVGGLVDRDELATGMGQTERELDLGMAAGQPLVAAARSRTRLAAITSRSLAASARLD